MNIYRQSALDKLSSPEQLDTMMSVIPSSLWIALVTVALILGAGILWGVVGTLPVTVAGAGILTRAGDTAKATSSSSGTVKSFVIDVGSDVKKDQVIATLDDGTKISSPIAGRVLALAVNPGDAVQKDAVIATIESTDDSANPLEAILYVSASDGQSITPGMAVQLSPSTVRTGESGFLNGRVKSVTKSPASPERISRILGSQDLASNMLGGGTYVEVVVDLLPGSGASGSYQWSLPQGASVNLYSGTTTNATITIGTQRPISLVFSSQ
jgi:hypothetical protein